jgi:hypothetical protein
MGSTRGCTWIGIFGWFLITIFGMNLRAGAASAANALIAAPLVEGTVLPSDLSTLRAAAEEALREQQFDLVAAADVESALSGEPQLKGCHSELCLERLGRVLDAQIVIRYRARLTAATGTQGGEWHLNVEILDVDVGAIGARLTEDCTKCTSKKAANHLLDMVRRSLLQNAAKPRGMLTVQSQPQGAAVFVDGTELGITPHKRMAFAGTHKLVLRYVGYRSEQLDVVVDETAGKRVDVTLNPGNDPVKVIVVEKEKAATPVYKRWWFWVAIGGAAVAAAAITAGVVVGTRGGSAEPRMVPSNTLSFMF